MSLGDVRSEFGLCLRLEIPTKYLLANLFFASRIAARKYLQIILEFSRGNAILNESIDGQMTWPSAEEIRAKLKILYLKMRFRRSAASRTTKTYVGEGFSHDDGNRKMVQL
jgi:hypothetical protein